MPSTKRSHRKRLKQAKTLKGPKLRTIVNTSNTNESTPKLSVAKERVRKPYVDPYVAGPEQNAFVESMRKYAENRSAATAATAAAATAATAAAAAAVKDTTMDAGKETTKDKWANWFRTDPTMKALANTTKPIGAWADLMEEEYKKNPDRLKPRVPGPGPAAPALAALVASASKAEAGAEQPPVPLPSVKGPVVKKSTKTQLVIGNLPSGITAGQLTSALERHGTITNINIPIDPATKYTKGFAFVTFSNPEGAAAALAALTGTLIFPNPLKKGPRVLVATLTYAEGKAKSKGTMRARE